MNKINLLDMLLIVVKNKKSIIIFTLIMSVIAVFYSLIVTEKWASEFTVYPISSEEFSVGSNLLSGLGLGASSTPKLLAYNYSAVLKSRTITEKAINEFNLIKYFEITTKDSLKAMDNAIKSFHSEMFDIMINDEVSFLTVKVTTIDKEFSKKISEFYLNELLNYAQNNVNNSGRQKRMLLESRINEISDKMKTLTNEIKEYQIDNNIIEIEDQAKASIEVYSNIIVEYFENELELNFAEQYMPNSLLHKELSAKHNIIKNNLKALQSVNEEIPFLLALENINDNRFTLEEKIYGLELMKIMLETLYPQYEIAKLEEIDNMDKLEIIDYPNLPGNRAYPKRALFCILVFITSLFFSCS